MYEKSYAQLEREAKTKRRIHVAAKIIALAIIVLPVLTIGFFIGRYTAPTPVAQTLQEEREYNPDPCTLNVVVCEDEVK